MLRMILAIAIGFIAWSVLWVGSDAVFSAISSDWAKTSTEFRAAVENKAPYSLSTTNLIVHLIKSFIISIISGFITAMIARENSKSTLILGILLLLFGIFVQSLHWSYMPLWYHIPFLLSLIPMTMLGGRLKKVGV